MELTLDIFHEADFNFSNVPSMKSASHHQLAWKRLAFSYFLILIITFRRIAFKHIFAKVWTFFNANINCIGKIRN